MVKQLADHNNALETDGVREVTPPQDQSARASRRRDCDRKKEEEAEKKKKKEEEDNDSEGLDHQFLSVINSVKNAHCEDE